MRKNRIILGFISLVAIVLVFCACSCTAVYRKVQLGETRDNLASRNIFPYHTYVSLEVFNENDEYQIVTFDQSGKVNGIAEFSSKRECINVQEIKLIMERDDWDKYMGKSLDEIESELGEFHSNIGSGRYLPGYVMEDAYFVYFESIVPPGGKTNGEGIVNRIRKIDLFAEKQTIVAEYTNE